MRGQGIVGQDWRLKCEGIRNPCFSGGIKGINRFDDRIKILFSPQVSRIMAWRRFSSRDLCFVFRILVGLLVYAFKLSFSISQVFAA